MGNIWSLLKATFQEFRDDKASRLAAALSFYTALSIAPLLVLLVTLMGWFLGGSDAQTQVVSQIQGLAGSEGADVAQSVLESADQPNLANLAGILSLLVLFWGASNVFAQLQDSLNTIWDVELKPDVGIMETAKNRLLSFGMILVIGFLLLVSLVLSTALSALGSGFAGILPGGLGWVWQVVEFVISFGVITLLFALIYRVLPDVKIGWRDVWAGAAVTALLFVIGKYLLSFYLSFQSTGSAYGAAGSLMVFLIWIYYSAQIFFFGAEFTQVYARRYGRGIVPDKKAQYVPGEAPEPQGAART
jgi:membrane protein